MAGYARVTINRHHIWVRFERIGQGSKFNLLLNVFRASFPLADWDEYHRAWRLPIEQLERAIQFCHHNLGAGNIKFQEYDTIISSLCQLSFF